MHFNMRWSQSIIRNSLNGVALTALLFFLSRANFGQGVPKYKAVAFDYFVIFDANSIVPAIEKEFPGKGADIAKAWRSKQFEYCFLRSITHEYRDFLLVTEDALVYTTSSMKLDLKEETRKRLVNEFLNLKLWPDATDCLRRLKEAGVRVITISNFSPRMLEANARKAGIRELFDEMISTETNHTYKPESAAYALGTEHLKLHKNEVAFAAFGAWDYYGAKQFGYPTYWVNRFHLPAEQLDASPDATSDSLKGLVHFVLGR
jgi:2-haloacid dehalogenase